eukprot:4475262-Pyramimonas_sp.AAC.1
MQAGAQQPAVDQNAGTGVPARLGFGRLVTPVPDEQRGGGQGSDSVNPCQTVVQRVVQTTTICNDAEPPPSTKPMPMGQQAEFHARRGRLTAVRGRSSAWSFDHYLFSDDFARRDWMIYCIPYVVNVFRPTPIFSQMFD